MEENSQEEGSERGGQQTDHPKRWPVMEIAQSSRRIKDKRLRRAYGILDTPCCQCSMVIKGL